MFTLTHAAFQRAGHFIKSQARPLDRALFEYRFEGAPPEPVIAELARFQNDDGGFGGALEPDVRTPTSSALATGIGLGLLRQLGCLDDHPMLRRAVAYLLETFDPVTGTWRVVPSDTNDYPHAPWWHDEDGSLARTFDDFLVIPRAQLLGLLHSYASLLPAGWLSDLTGRTLADIAALETERYGGGGDTLEYALFLAESLPEALQQRLLPRLRQVALQVISTDPAEWGGYCAAPLKVIHSPQSPIADLFPAALQAHLDYQIERQSPQGSWEPNWSWGEAFPQDWARARDEWRGHLTLQTLTTLRAFGRIEI